MTFEQIRAAAGLYSSILQDKDVEATRHSDHEGLTEAQFLEHALWMCREVLEMGDGHREKAMRWICFVQGVLWRTGLRSIHQMRDDNR